MRNMGQRYICLLHNITMLPSISFHIGNSEDRFGAWSTEECREVVREGSRRECECSQLAHFGILFVRQAC